MTQDNPASIVSYLKTAWSDTVPAIRTLTIGMWFAGTVLAVAGLTLDFFDLWSRYPFLVNMSSAFVGALFAVPLAVIVFQEVARYQASSVLGNQAVRQYRETHTAFVAALRTVKVSLNRMMALSAYLAEAAEVAGELKRKSHERKNRTPQEIYQDNAAIETELAPHIVRWCEVHPEYRESARQLLTAWTSYRPALAGGPAIQGLPYPPAAVATSVDMLIAELVRTSELDRIERVKTWNKSDPSFPTWAASAFLVANEAVVAAARASDQLHRLFPASDPQQPDDAARHKRTEQP